MNISNFETRIIHMSINCLNFNFIYFKFHNLKSQVYFVSIINNYKIIFRITEFTFFNFLSIPKFYSLNLIDNTT